MINAVRARAVDVEIGATPDARGTLAPEAPLQPARKPAQPRRARTASSTAPTPEPAPFVAVYTAPAAPAGGDILWADEPLPGDGHGRAWTRGLRG